MVRSSYRNPILRLLSGKICLNGELFVKNPASTSYQYGVPMNLLTFRKCSEKTKIFKFWRFGFSDLNFHKIGEQCEFKKLKNSTHLVNSGSKENRLTTTKSTFLKKVNFPNSAGWTPNKQLCFSKSAPFRILSPRSKLWWQPYLQPSGQVMVDLKLWFQSDLLNVTKV